MGNQKYTDRIGETRINSKGLQITLVAYRNANDVDVQFDDGTTVCHREYRKFDQGKIAYPTDYTTSRVGEQNVAKNGMTMTIIAYRGTFDIDVQFTDGYIAEHRSYRNFRLGDIANPNVIPTAYLKRIGECSRAQNGMMMTIIAYRTNNDIDVRFEDGYVKEHVVYGNFLRGVVKHPDLNMRATHQVGDTGIAKNGLAMKIIAYRKANDIDIQFEDGTVVTHTDCHRFDKGSIGHPTIKTPKLRKVVKDHIGEESISSCGLRMTIIAFRNKMDLDVMFEDGVVVYHKSRANFLKGSVAHPTHTTRWQSLIHQKQKTARLGNLRINKSGIPMKISEYLGANNITVSFDTGYTTEHHSYYNFMSGAIIHPFPYNVGSVVMIKPAYIYGEIGNFYCTCDKCGYSDIMTIPEMKSHICNI